MRAVIAATFWVTVLLGGWVVGSAAAHPAHGSAASLTTRLPKAAESVARTVDAFHAALARGDTNGAAALLAEDATVFEQGEAELSKSAYTASHLAADIAYLREVRESVTGRSGGVTGRLAWIATQGRFHGGFQDRDVDRQTTETMVLRLTTEGWRIAHVHWSSHGAKAPGAKSEPGHP